MHPQVDWRSSTVAVPRKRVNGRRDKVPERMAALATKRKGKLTTWVSTLPCLSQKNVSTSALILGCSNLVLGSRHIVPKLEHSVRESATVQRNSFLFSSTFASIWSPGPIDRSLHPFGTPAPATRNTARPISLTIAISPSHDCLGQPQPSTYDSLAYLTLALGFRLPTD